MSALTDYVRRVRRVVAPGVKNLAAAAAYGTGAYAALGTKYAGRGVIIMLHRVCADSRPILYPGYMIPVSALDRLVASVRDSGWDIIGLDELAPRLKRGTPGRRFVCFTFDDGYADNLSLALPVFRKYAAPMAVYIAVGMLERQIHYWWGALEALVLQSDVIHVPGFEGHAAETLPARTFEEKGAAYAALDELGHTFGDRFFTAITPVWREAAVDPSAILDRDALSLDQARTLARDPLVTIGAHTISHARLALLAADDAAREISESRRRLQHALELDVRHFAYPFGGPNSCGAREFTMAREAGYETAVTTRRGNVFSEHQNHLHALPRRNVPTTRRHLLNVLYGLETLRRREPVFRTA